MSRENNESGIAASRRPAFFTTANKGNIPALIYVCMGEFEHHELSCLTRQTI